MTNKPQIQKVYDLSPMQEGMLFHCQLEDISNVYFEQTVFTLKGYINIELFEKSFNLLIKRHDIFKTIFFYKNVQKFSQVVLKERQTSIYFEDISCFDDKSKIQYVNDFLEKDKQRGFDLSRDMLIRISILKTSEEQYKLIWSFHHILMDGWCLRIVNKEILDIYSSLLNNTPLKLKDAPIYKDYIDWLRAQDKKAADAYWTDYLANYESQAMIPRMTLTAKNSKYNKADLHIKIQDDIVQNLSNIAKKNRTTLNTIFQAIWGILLQKYNYTTDVVFGAVVSGRGAEVEGIEDMVGLFINTIPIRINCNSSTSFTEFILKIQENNLSSEKYSYCSLSDIQQCSTLKNKLINHILVYENYPLDDSLNNIEDKNRTGFVLESYETFEQTNYDLNVIIIPNNGIDIMFKYNTNVYDRSIIEALGKQITETAEKIIRDPDIEIQDLEIINSEEKTKILFDFNNTGVEYPHNKTINQLFEEQVKKTPDNTAVIYGNQKLTYKELNTKSNQLAKVISKRAANSKAEQPENMPSSIVAIMAERSLEMIIGMLAALKAGCAYLPIDTEYPEERIQHMLNDSKADIVLTQSWIERGVTSRVVIKLDDYSIYQGEEDKLRGIEAGTPLAYIMYTSGSTGKPKGVLIEHKNVIRLVKNTNYISFEGDDRILQTGAMVFDACTFEVWGALLNGLELYIIDKNKILDADELENALTINRITILWLTSSLFNKLAQQKPEMFSKLRYLLVGGDVLSPKYINMIRSTCKELKIINGYGPTENTTFSTCHLIDREYEANIPIGKPISNSKAYIIDRFNKLCPIGAVGELCVGGDGLARGYLNNAELTAEKFIKNPYCTGEIIYRTGDLARWMPDGNIDFLGRIDHQIKLRGYRIELGEIESKLKSHPNIKEAAVLLKEDSSNNKYLCAYYTGEKNLTSTELREFLSKELPDYMMPSSFIQLDYMALTFNGKIDRKLLPEPDRNTAGGIEYEAPRNSIEDKLVDIWKKTLDINILGINDNFFELGGDSIRAMQLSSLLQKEFGTSVSLTEIFKNPTISGISKIINHSKTSIYNELTRLPDSDYYDLSYSQKRLWIINQREPESIAYNMPGRFRVSDCNNEAVIKKVFKELSQRHEAFRTSFNMINGEPMQIISDEIEWDIETIDISSKDYSEKEVLLEEIYAAEANKRFNLKKPPLVNIKLVRLNAAELEVIFVMHHIISDGFSFNILKNEFEYLYKIHTKELANELTPLKIQYRDFAAWQNSYIKNHSEEARLYWTKKLASVPLKLNLPANTAFIEKVNKESAGYKTTISNGTKNKLLNFAKANNTSLFIVLLAGFNAFLANLTGQKDIFLGIPAMGREHDDLKNVIGYFVNTLLLSNTIDLEASFLELLKIINEDTLKALEYQYYPLELAVDELKINYPQIRVFFNMLNFNKSKENYLKSHDTCHIERVQDVKFDIVLYITEYKDGIEIMCSYYSSLFESSRIEMLIKNYIKLLDEISKNPGGIIKSYFRTEKARVLKRN